MEENNGFYYEDSCDYLYSNLVHRVNEKYMMWKKVNPVYNANVDFFPSDSKKLGRLLSGKRKTCSNYSLGTALEKALVEKLEFKDVNELYWGQDIDLYFEDLFIKSVLDMQKENDYSKQWIGIKLESEKDVKSFYLLHKDELSGERVENNIQSNSLKDKFIDFTYNSYDYFDFCEKNKIGNYLESSIVTNHDNLDSLTFYKLQDKIRLFSECVVAPAIGSICLSKFIDTVLID